MTDSDTVNGGDGPPQGAQPPYISTDNNPVSILHSKLMGMSNKDEENFDIEPHRRSIGFFLEYLFTQPTCVNMQNTKRPCHCSCLTSLPITDADKRDVWDYLVKFARLTKNEQNKIVFQWMRYSLGLTASPDEVEGNASAFNKRLFLLPGTLHMVCLNACMRMIGWGPRGWKSLMRSAKTNQFPVHGNAGSASNNALKVTTQIHLDSFFSGLKEYAAPRATRQVRIIVAGGDDNKLELRDKDVELLELPPYYNRNNLYIMWCKSVGYRPRFDSIHRLVEMEPLGGPSAPRIPRKEVVSLPTFGKYWKTNFPKVVTQRPREDVCEECFAFANRHRYKEQRQEIKDSIQAAAAEAGHELFTEEDLEVALGDKAFSKKEDKVTIANVTKHVEMQKLQRDLVIKLRAEAYSDRNKPRHQRRYTFVADFAQNCYVPNFADEQPGKTYFLSPLNAYVFGICDASTKPTELSAHFYMGEPDGAKGGNNVASLLWKELIRKQLLPSNCPTREAPMGRSHKATDEVNFVFDNCTGQNKNRYVLRMLFFMVQRRVAKVARCVFLVRGHTKNECDRMFNAMKHEYRKINVYTPADLFKALDKHEQCTAVPVQPGDMNDWGELQDEYMKSIKNIKMYHIFEVNDIDPYTLWCQEYDGQPWVKQSLVLKKPLRRKNSPWMYEWNPERLLVPGIRYLTWKEIYDKWKPVIPQEKWDQWKYLKEDLPQEKRKAITANTQESKKSRRGRERENNNKKDVGEIAGV